MSWLLGLLGSGAIAGLAYWRKSLSRSGALAAVVVGTLMYALGSAAWFGTLIAFFITSTLLSKWKRRAKAEAESGYEKSGRRDARQVLANGGLATLLCAGHTVWPHAAWWWAFVGVMATVNADTWATEIGGFSRKPPVSIRTGKRVVPGTSGGVTLLGLAATAMGAAFIGAAAWCFASLSRSSLEAEASAAIPLASLAQLALVAFVAGTAGSLADSWLGAAWQAMRRCNVCGREVERTVHCGCPTLPARGIRWLNNDAVNALSSLIGGSLAVDLAYWLTNV